MNDSDFGDVYRAWEKRSNKNKNASGASRIDMESLIDLHPPDEDRVAEKETELAGNMQSAEIRKKLISMAPQATIDLHGSTVDEAIAFTQQFLQSSQKRGLEKVLIVHGKGRHTVDGVSSLREAIRLFVAQSPIAGQTGIPPERFGGSGAMWVIIRQRSR